MTETLPRPGGSRGGRGGRRPVRGHPSGSLPGSGRRGATARLAPARQRHPPPRRGGATRGLLLPGALGAAGAVLLGVVAVEVVVLLAWAGDSRAGAGAGQALRVGVSVWLSGLHTRVHAGPAVVGVAPLGLTLLVAALAARSAQGLIHARQERGERYDGWAREGLAASVAVAVPHGVLAAVLAGLAGTPQLHPSPATALVGGTAVGGAGALAGVARARRRVGARPLLALLPPYPAAAMAGGLAALAALSAAACLLAAAAVAAHTGAAAGTSAALAPGIVGGLALLLLEVCLAPNVAVCALAWLAGPGFAVGDGTSVTPWGTTVGRVPALPLLSALPSGARGPGAAVLLVVLLAGGVGGLVVGRRVPGLSWPRVAGLASGAGPVAGLLAGLAAAAAGGPAGVGRLHAVGPSWWQVGLAIGAEVGLAAAVAAGTRVWWRARRSARAVPAQAGGAAGP